MLTERGHGRCNNHTSIMRGVCLCQTDNVIFVNPRLFADGAAELRPASELDEMAMDVVESILLRFFPQFGDVYVSATSCDVVMPGMMMELEQHTGVGGYHAFTRMS